MNKPIVSILLLSALSLVVFMGFNRVEKTSVEESLVGWMSFEQAIEKGEQAPKKIFIDVYTDWCGWCKKMDASTFSDPEVAKILGDKFYPVKLNAERKDTMIVGGRTYAYLPQPNGRGVHQIAVALLNGKLSYPTVVVLDEKFNMITPLPGYRDAASMKKILRYYGEDHYKSMTYEQFTANGN